MENYTITKEHILQLDNFILKDNVSKNLKIWFPSAFEKEFRVGKWYKTDKNIFYCTEINERGTLFGYGLFNGIWKEYFNDGGRYCACNHLAAEDRLIEATPEEVAESLINEAKKRGFKKGVTCVFGIAKEKRVLETDDFMLSVGCLCVKRFNSYTSDIIFEDGKWKDILPQETKVESTKKTLEIVAGESYICRKTVIDDLNSEEYFKKGTIYHCERQDHLTNEISKMHEMSKPFAYKHFLHLPK